MKSHIVRLLAGAMLLAGATTAFAVETVIEGFENNTDPGGWRQVSPVPGQGRNVLNAVVPTYVTANVTEGLAAGEFTMDWVLPGTDPGTANVFIAAGPTLYWAQRTDLQFPALLNSNTIPHSTGILRVDVFNPSTTDTVQFALYLQDSAGTGGLERGPFKDLPPNTSTTYEWDLPSEPATGWVTGDGTLDGSSSILRGFFVYTETTPTTDPLLLTLDNIRVDTVQTDLTPPAAPRIISLAQGPAAGELVVTWQAPADVDLDGFYVYLATDDDFGVSITNRFTFPSTPVATINSPATLTTTLTGVPTAENVYVRVTAFDTATPSPNESVSDIVLGARLRADGAAPGDLLVLDLDRYTAATPDFTVNGYFHAAVYWGHSIHDLDQYYVSCRPDAIDSAAVTLTPNDDNVVYWTTARDGEAVAAETLTVASRTAIANFLTANGNLVIAGTSLGEDLFTNGDGTAQTFYTNTLHATLLNENSAVGVVNADGTYFPNAGGFATSPNIFDPAAGSNTDNEVLSAGAGAIGALTYDTIATGNAAVLNNASLVYFGFGFETVRNPATEAGAAGFTAARAKRTALLRDAVLYISNLPVPVQLNTTGNWPIYE